MNFSIKNNSFCVIPARSGSKTLKHKNILDLCEKPVLCHTIKACLDSQIFDKVYVATDSREYADIAVKAGAEVPFLEPADMAGDMIGSSVPLIHLYKSLILDNLSSSETEKALDDHILWCMQPTSPLKNANDIIRGHEIISSNKECDFLVSVSDIDPHYFHWALESDDKGFSNLYFGEKMLVDRSLLRPVVKRPNGAIKAARARALLKYNHFFGPNLMTVSMPEERSIHIRTSHDLDLCRFMLSKKSSKLS